MGLVSVESGEEGGRDRSGEEEGPPLKDGRKKAETVAENAEEFVVFPCI